MPLHVSVATSVSAASIAHLGHLISLLLGLLPPSPFSHQPRLHQRLEPWSWPQSYWNALVGWGGEALMKVGHA